MSVHAGVSAVKVKPAAANRIWSQVDGLTLGSLIVLCVLVILGVAGQLQTFGDPTAFVADRLSPPSSALPFGSDDLGRSMVPRILEGVGNTIVVALLAVTVSTLLATALAVSAGYLKGLVDRVVVGLADVLFSFPALLFAILIAAVLGPGRPAAIAATILVTAPRMMRVIRQAAIAVAERDFVVTAEVSGISPLRIMATHIVPNIGGTIVVQATFAMSVAILVESGLSFLRLGVQPPSASLGSLVSGGLDALALAPWLVFIPGAVLVVAISTFNLAGDGMRDALEPRNVRSLE